MQADSTAPVTDALDRRASRASGAGAIESGLVELLYTTTQFLVMTSLFCFVVDPVYFAISYYVLVSPPGWYLWLKPVSWRFLHGEDFYS